MASFRLSHAKYALIPALLMGAGSAQAQTVNLIGTVVNLCVLTISTPGSLAISSNGLQLSTTNGGLPASLTVVATGSNPTISFSSPSLVGPSSGGATTEVAYSSTGGASHAYDSSGYVYAMNRLLDTVTINGRASNSSGFRSGVYTISATATCSQ
ncbi:hypothetical protein LWE61_08665 [Sphingobium sufflavum]|uniref:hypothetical protein n=1 Tax=Sphingobium sufflavum TaxID=1129547 RepID=UPI001F204AED|nr:hypothetical protein [Sphingobium sufflavum]MCE7796630.1 hypothetical protein [Sphingobium sufflavum]